MYDYAHESGADLFRPATEKPGFRIGKQVTETIENAGAGDRVAPISGYLYVISAAALWGVAGPVAKYLFGRGVTPLALTQVRMTLSFVLMMSYFLIARRDLARIKAKDVPYLATLGIGGFALVQITYYSAIASIQVAAAILLQYMAPVLILIYAAIFMKEKITRSKLASLVLAVTGCALVAGSYNIDFLKLNMTGVAWGLASAACFSFYTLYGQSGLKKHDALTLFTYSSGFGALMWWVLNPPRAFFAVDYAPVTWIAFLYVTILGTIVPFVFYLKALESMEASRVSITSTIEPVIAGLVAFIFIGENMGPLQVLGGALVIGGIILLQRSPTPELTHRPIQDGGAL
jgi:drug/metabolite transporter (DMT)-like permease